VAWFRLLPPADPSIVRVSRELMRSWHLRGWFAAALFVTAMVVNLPLFGVVGFELSLVCAGFGSLVGLVLGAALVRRAQLTRARPLDRAVPPPRLVLALVGHAPLAPLLVLLVPLAGAALHGIWVPTCDWTYGLEAYAILALASTVLAAGSGALVALWTGPSRRRLVPALVALVVALIAAGLYRFYSEPPVFSYNPLIGFFPGNLYDEDIRLDAALYWSRLEQLATLLALLGATTIVVDAPSLRVRVRGRRHRPALAGLWLAVPAALVALALRYNAASLGYAIDAEDIQAELGGIRRTEHFVIHYDRHDPDVVKQIDLYAADHEFRLAQVCRTLGVDVASVGTIHSYVFANDERKGELMGARGVEMAKPWRREIYLSFNDFPHPSLSHELAHVVAGTFGSPLFHVSARNVVLINPGLVEGLAVAAAWTDQGGLTPHQAMRAMDKLGLAPSVKKVFSLQFLTLANQRSYVAAGSFMRFLLDTRGPARLRRLYASGGDFWGTYNASMGSLVQQWREMLAKIDVPDADLEVARARYRTPGVFQRPCPHANAARVRRAQELPQPDAVRLLRQVCKNAPEDPRFQFALARRLADGAAAEVAEARTIFERFVGAESGTILAARALQALIVLDASKRDFGSVRTRLDRALSLAVDDDTRRTFEAEDLALRATGFAGYFLRGYFFEPGDDAVWSFLVALFRDDGFGWYLFGLQAAQSPALSAQALTFALERGPPGSRFVRNAARKLAVAAWSAGDRHGIDLAIETLGESSYETDRALASDWRERLAFGVSVTSR
jgi:hypothetical protein